MNLHRTEAELWRSFCAGDENSLVGLYEQYYTTFFVWGCKWLGGEADFVKDQLHDFFIYIWERRERLALDINVKAYLLTSFRRQLLYQWKKHKKSEPIENFVDTLEIYESELLDAESITEQFAQLEKALTLLSPAQREVVELRFLQNKTMQEIADHKNTSLRTVYNLLHRGVNKLRSEINEKNFLWLW
ncbi:sigma-70 family RNA polymerase sigma factor [Pedobacter sp. HDW13]|uniref:RNA polymerase sigma factor n=1 Tax=Pedobacter sp. HDW13 TaxID=2714940 RepID=UPI00140C4D0F|nr:sigma-70 family RNA polymerase sigma factor [Pedobacter sp. HDW13]QIL40384.1 sigma-70 family RNA polymerase sigma factor [Pedobacter sp. HDW13]